MVVLGFLEPTCDPVALCYAFPTSVPSLPVTLSLKIDLKSLPKDAIHCPSRELCLPLLSCLPWHRQARQCLLPPLPWQPPLSPALLGPFKLQAFCLHASLGDRGICPSRQHLSSLKQFLPQM